MGPGAEHPIFDYCGEESVKAAADALASDELGLFAAGYRHFHLDDCWAGGRFANGSVYPEADHFPNGMKPVVDYVHSKGLTFGLCVPVAAVVVPASHAVVMLLCLLQLCQVHVRRHGGARSCHACRLASPRRFLHHLF